MQSKYYPKYLKYKSKYINLKRDFDNGSFSIDNLIQDMKRNPNPYQQMLLDFQIEIKIEDLTNNNLINILCSKVPKTDKTPAEINKRIKKRRTIIKELIGNAITPNMKYLDIGCGDGTITRGIAKYFNLDPNNVYGVDVKSWSGKENQCQVQHMYYIDETNNKLPYQDNHFDFITCFQVLHHAKHYTELINEIKRVLKPNGYLILREHDLNNGLTKELIDFEHLIHMCIEQQDKVELDKYYGSYRPKSMWTSLINLKLIKCTGIYTLTRYYTCAFKK
jgi:ubiquinone/menaquinone biosynthesis C-methylase UbiE